MLIILAIPQLAIGWTNCFDWFLDQKRSPTESREDCQFGCASAMKDMGTFTCAERCDYFCKNKKCSKIWEQDNKVPCKPLNSDLRTKLLAQSDPKNFLKVKYESPPQSDQATDCSHFVHNIYSKSGFNFAYQPTDSIGIQKLNIKYFGKPTICLSWGCD